MSFSLYIHIPFCRKKCNYCDFPSYAGKEAFINEYIDALRAESGYYSSLYDRPKVRTVYFGGGTPTLLNEEQIAEIFENITKDFDIATDAEISMEANPGTLTSSKLRSLKKCGVNRISLGAQSFNDSSLKRLGRIHRSHQTIEAYDMIRAAGFRNVNIDLMFALPGENLKDWNNTLKSAVNLKPEHLSIYNLQVEEGTPIYMERVEGSLKLPDEEKELDMYRIAIRYLVINGYEQYEISNFAKKGFKCSHNITYWSFDEYIGIGLGAHSFLEKSRIENTVDLEKYLSQNIKDIKNEHKNTKKESIQEAIFLGLRLTGGVDRLDFKRRFKVDIQKQYKDEIGSLQADGLIDVSENAVKLTRKGLYIANEVFIKFL